MIIFRILCEIVGIVWFGAVVVNIVLSSLGWVRPWRIPRGVIVFSFIITMLITASMLQDDLDALLRGDQ